MEADASLLSFNVALGVLFVDILLSGDNAIVIALVCRSLSKEHRVKALWLGVLGAFLARLVLTGFATLAMNIPLIKLVGGFLLLKISIDLIVDNFQDEGTASDTRHSPSVDIFSAAKTIVIADVVMSIDNVLALSAITQNNFSMLIGGLLLSIPILMFGSLYISRLLDVFPYLLWIGGAILGGVSGALIIDDPVFRGLFVNAASVSSMLVPVFFAIFVVLQSRIIISNEQSMRTLPKPNSVFKILWPSSAESTQPKVAVHSESNEVSAAPQVLQESIISPKEFANSLTATARGKSVGSSGDGFFQSGYRILMALGLVIFLIGFGIRYLVNSPLMPQPEGFITYKCTDPALAISYRPNAKQIRFTSTKGIVSAKVTEDRIVWDDYRLASVALSIPPPVKIISADLSKLVVNGGMFDNVSCSAATK